MGKPDQPDVSDFCAAMDSIAPIALAQSWDNVGLIAGDENAPLRRVLLCIDLMPGVVEEAIEGKIDLIMAYHPPVFKPILTIRKGSPEMDSVVFRCIEAGVAIYSTHTALDAAPGGTNDLLAEYCGISNLLPFNFVDRPGAKQVKLVVFVPPKEVVAVSQAMFDAGAGHIGDYSHCSYRGSGQGSFLGGDETNPTVGRKGRLEFVEEVRLETLVRANSLPAVITAMREAHSYEEPAFDIYPLQPPPAFGIGRVGALPESISLHNLAELLRTKTAAASVQIVGTANEKVKRAVILAGAAGAMPFSVGIGPGDVVITGEIRHHDALGILRRGASAIALGHWSSERPSLERLADRLGTALPSASIQISNADREPFSPV